MTGLLSVSEAAALAGVAASTWRTYVARGQAPAPDVYVTPDRPRWRRATVEAWMAARPGQGTRTDLRQET